MWWINYYHPVRYLAFFTCIPLWLRTPGHSKWSVAASQEEFHVNFINWRSHEINKGSDFNKAIGFGGFRYQRLLNYVDYNYIVEWENGYERWFVEDLKGMAVVYFKVTRPVLFWKDQGEA